jgi:hypothetical protein
MKTRLSLAVASLSLIAATQAFAVDTTDAQVAWPALDAPAYTGKLDAGNNIVAPYAESQVTWDAIDTPVVSGAAIRREAAAAGSEVKQEARKLRTSFRNLDAPQRQDGAYTGDSQVYWQAIEG